MRITLRTIGIMGVCAVMAGCAKHTNEIPAQYVSPMQYSSYRCKQIQTEMQSVSSRVSEIGAQVEKTAGDDDVQMGVGLVLFWPTLFFLDGNTPQAAEYGRLRGEFDALEKAAIRKNCGFHIERPVVKAPTPPTNTPSNQPIRHR